jgi:hypothetical protein
MTPLNFRASVWLHYRIVSSSAMADGIVRVST